MKQRRGLSVCQMEEGFLRPRLVNDVKARRIFVPRVVSNSFPYLFVVCDAISGSRGAPWKKSVRFCQINALSFSVLLSCRVMSSSFCRLFPGTDEVSHT